MSVCCTRSGYLLTDKVLLYSVDFIGLEMIYNSFGKGFQENYP